MNLLILINLIDKNLVYAFICSIFSIIINKIILFIILNIPDNSLSFIDNLIKLKQLDNSNLFEFSDSDDSENESRSNSETESSLEKETYTSIKKEKTLEEYNKYIAEWEYEVILRMFNIPNIKINRLDDIDKFKVPIMNNIIHNYKNKNLINYNNYDNLEIVIADCFLFNIKINSEEIDGKFDICMYKILSLKRKIKLFYMLQNKLNTSVIHNLFPYYKYLYILYKKNPEEYNYILIDLENNYDLIKNKKVLFNIINL